MSDILSRARMYVREKGKPAADYLAEKFSKHDIVLLGEDHGIRENLRFVASLIPKLYHVGVTNLGMEFGSYEDQDELDELVRGDSYSEDTARKLQFHYNVSWPFREYQEIYRAAWEFNRTLAPGSRKFRVLSLSYCYQWQHFDGCRLPSAAQRIFCKGPVEKFRADVIKREVMDKKEKILVLTGTIHAFTRYHYAVYDPLAFGFCRYIDRDLGHLLYESYGERTACILLHQMFGKGVESYTTCADGILEKILAEYGGNVGLDIRDSVLGELADHSNYSEGYEEFKLRELCDGYIFLKPASRLHGCTIDEKFIDGHTLEEIAHKYPDPDWHGRPDDRESYWKWAREFVSLKRYRRGEENGKNRDTQAD